MGNEASSASRSAIASAVRAFYSWHHSLPIGTTRYAVVAPDSMIGLMVILATIMLGIIILPIHPMHQILAATVFALVSPVFAWQIVIVSARGTTVFRTILAVPYWVTKIPAGVDVELYEAWEDPAPSGVAYRLRNDYVHVGNGWNAQPLFSLLRRCEERVRGAQRNL